MPNLVFEEITSPESSSSGNSISVEIEVNNTGREDAVDEFTVAAYLSVDGILTDRDHFIGNTTMNNIAIGQSATTTIVGTIPSIIVPGNYYVFVEPVSYTHLTLPTKA